MKLGAELSAALREARAAAVPHELRQGVAELVWWFENFEAVYIERAAAGWENARERLVQQRKAAERALRKLRAYGALESA